MKPGYHRGPRTALRELRIDGQDFAALAWMLDFYCSADLESLWNKRNVEKHLEKISP